MKEKDEKDLWCRQTKPKCLVGEIRGFCFPSLLPLCFLETPYPLTILFARAHLSLLSTQRPETVFLVAQKMKSGFHVWYLRWPQAHWRLQCASAIFTCMHRCLSSTSDTASAPFLYVTNTYRMPGMCPSSSRLLPLCARYELRNCRKGRKGLELVNGE